jgi:arginine decarboxylase
MPTPYTLCPDDCSEGLAGSSVLARNGLTIHVSAAAGQGPTSLAAFDDALLGVGAANYNLVRLSSVIPTRAVLIQHPGAMPCPGGIWGDRLYVVYAAHSACGPGDEAWAGVGWVQDRTGRGLFVEHEGPDEDEVRARIVASLIALQTGRGVRLGPIRSRVVGARCVNEPVCALVLCAYATEPWADGRVA